MLNLENRKNFCVFLLTLSKFFDKLTLHLAVVIYGGVA